MREAVLILTNSKDATADYLQASLAETDPRVLRYDTDIDLPATVIVYRDAVPSIRWNGHNLQADQIHTIILRRPGPFQPQAAGDPYQKEHAAGEWREAWEGFLAHIPLERWINHPSRNFSSSHKIEQLSRAERFGLAVPNSLVTNDPAEAVRFVRAQDCAIVVKTLANGYIERDQPERDTLIYARQLPMDDLSLLDSIGSCPVLFQERIRKTLDVRMTVLDDQILSVGLKADDDGEQRLDIRRENMRGVRYLPVAAPERVQMSVRDLLKSYGLRFAALDFVVRDDGKWIFLEVNPNGQWAWLDLVGGFAIKDLFAKAISR